MVESLKYQSNPFDIKDTPKAFDGFEKQAKSV